MMDFVKWQAETNEKYGLKEEDWKEIKEAAILTFGLDSMGRVSSTHNKRHVIKHRDSEKTIMLGETWICSVTKPPLVDTYYFAKGLVRIDPSFLYELKKDQMDEIASYVWEKQRHIIEPGLKEKYDDMVKKDLAQAVEETRKGYEAEISALKEMIKGLEQKDAENKNIISSLHGKLDAATATRPVQDVPAPGGHVMYHLPVQKISVRRSGPDSIFSESFSKSRYYVHMSADHRMMIVRPHEEGNIVCMNNTIVLERLSEISSFSGPHEMVSEYNPVYGGIQIYL